MSEFQDRISFQRKVIDLVNSSSWREPLMGLSRKSIERWLAQNSLTSETDLGQILEKIGAKLFFLANRSQVQITDENKNAFDEITELVTNLEKLLSNRNVGIS